MSDKAILGPKSTDMYWYKLYLVIKAAEECFWVLCSHNIYTMPPFIQKEPVFTQISYLILELLSYCCFYKEVTQKVTTV